MSLKKYQTEYPSSRLDGGMKVQAGNNPHRDDQPVSFTGAVGGKPGLGLPCPFPPRPVRRLGCNRGSGSSPGEPKWVSFFVQCQDCLETFSIEAMVSCGIIIKLDDHRRVARRNGDVFHRCGGNGHKEGRLSFYQEYVNLGDRRAK